MPDDPFKFHQQGLDSPARLHFILTKSDTVDLPTRPRVIVPLATGTVALRDDAGVVVTYPAFAGLPISFSPVRLMSTDTNVPVVGWL